MANIDSALATPSDEDCSLISLLEAKAYQLLARREYSVFELRRKFNALAPGHIATQVLNELIQQGMQSDKRFAEMLVRARFNAGKGPAILKHELDKHHIDTDLIDSAMAVYQHQWGALAEQVRIKKFGEQPPTNFKEWAKQARFLQSRGFTSTQIGQFNH